MKSPSRRRSRVISFEDMASVRGDGGCRKGRARGGGAAEIPWPEFMVEVAFLARSGSMCVTREEECPGEDKNFAECRHAGECIDAIMSAFSVGVGVGGDDNITGRHSSLPDPKLKRLLLSLSAVKGALVEIGCVIPEMQHTEDAAKLAARCAVREQPVSSSGSQLCLLYASFMWRRTDDVEWLGHTEATKTPTNGDDRRHIPWWLIEPGYARSGDAFVRGLRTKLGEKTPPKPSDPPPKEPTVEHGSNNNGQNLLRSIISLVSEWSKRLCDDAYLLIGALVMASYASPGGSWMYRIVDGLWTGTQYDASDTNACRHMLDTTVKSRVPKMSSHWSDKVFSQACVFAASVARDAGLVNVTCVKREWSIAEVALRERERFVARLARTESGYGLSHMCSGF
jgi:hypothetical protein